MSRNPVHAVAAVVLTLAVTAGLTLTTATPASARKLNLHQGSRGPSVLVLERNLAALGFLPGKAVDRRFTKTTKRAVKRFQAKHHLRRTGRVNTYTLRLAQREVAAKAARERAAARPVTPRPKVTPLILGHRGAVVAAAPENTLESMRYATGTADLFEFDLRLTSDRVWVLMHDPTLDRTTDCTGPVSDISSTDLRANCLAQSASGATAPVPTFEEVAQYAASVSTNIAPQLLGTTLTQASDLDSLFATLDATGMRSRTVFQSFSPAHFPRLRARDAKIPFVYLVKDVTTVTPADVKRLGVTVLGPSMNRLSQAHVASFQRAGLKVWPYTATTVAQLLWVQDLGADGVFTDLPVEARALYYPAT